MIGKHVVIDTLDNFKTKLDLIPSSAIVLIKDVGQIYAHGTYFGAQKTYSLLTKTADGLAPKGGTSASSLISNVDTEWVLTVTNGENPTWRKLPANAFSSSSYTLPSATTSDLGGIKVGQVYTATFDDLVGLYYKINIDKNGLAYVHVPWTDTNNIFVGATETKNGSSGMVPAPIANQHRYFLRGDGTWVKPNLSDLNDDIVNGKYLPLTGGTITGSGTDVLYINSTYGNVNDNGTYIILQHKGVKTAEFGHGWGIGTYIKANKYNLRIDNDGIGYVTNNVILHLGNYTNYALSVNGGTLNGNVTALSIFPLNDTYQLGSSSSHWGNVHSEHGTFYSSLTVNGSNVWTAATLNPENYLTKHNPVYKGILSTKEPGLYQEAETLFFRNASNTADYGTQIVNNWNDGSSKTTRFILDKTGIRFIDVNGYSRTIYHSGNFNPSDYVPLTGGVAMTGTLAIKTSGTILTIRSSNGGTPYINFRSDIDGTNTDLGDLGVDTSKNLVYYKGGWKKVWHEGNLKNLSDLTDDIVSGKYLPLSGGTVNGVLTLKKNENVILTINSTNGNPAILFQKNGTNLNRLFSSPDDGMLYRADATWSKQYQIFDTGNFTPSDYLPRTGGKISRDNVTLLSINNTGESSIIESGIRYEIKEAAKAWIGYNSTYGAAIYNYAKNWWFGLKDDGSLGYSGGTILHSNNYSSYALPLTGGTLTQTENKTSLLFKNTNYDPYISFQKGTAILGHIVVNSSGVLQYHPQSETNYHTIIHSGNIGSQSVSYASSAGNASGLTSNITSKSETKLSFYSAFLVKGDTTDFSWCSPTGSYESGSVTGEYMGIIRINMGNGTAKYYHDLSFNMNGRSPQWRQVVGGNSQGWRKFAFEDSNVASATKLQTARTIWGQPFDGTGNVSGHFSTTGNINGDSLYCRVVFVGRDTEGIYLSGKGIYFHDSSNKWAKDLIFFGSDGSTSIKGTLSVTDASTFSGKATFTSTDGVSIYNDVSVGGNAIFANMRGVVLKDTNGASFSALSTYYNDIHLASGANSKGYTTYINGYDIRFRYGNLSTNGLILNSSGNVGIGTTNPQYKLDVNGSFNATTIYQNGSSLSSLLDTKLNSSSYTASDILTKLKTVDGSGTELDADLLDGQHASAFVTRLGRYQLATSDVKPYTYVHLFRIGVASGYSARSFDFSIKTRYNSVNFYINISTSKYPYNSGGSSIVIHKEVKSGRDLNIYYVPTINSSGYNYYDVYCLMSAWNAGHYDLINLGGSGTVVFEDKRIYLDSLPTGYTAVTESYVSKATYANQLSTSRTIWGLSFDGTGNVSGNMTGVDSITMSSDIFMNNNMGIAIKNTSGAYKYILLLSNNNRAYFGYPDLDSYIRGNNVNITYGSSQTSGIYLNSSGNVGIGTTNPAYKLDVNGTIASTSTNNSARMITNADCGLYMTSSNQWLHIAGKGSLMLIYNGEWDNKGQGNYNKGIVITTSNNVGIGTKSPSYKLDVTGTFNASSNASIGGTLSVTGTTTLSSDLNVSGTIYLGTNHYIRKDTSGLFMYNVSAKNYIELYDNTNIVLNGGNVGIGTTAPDYKLHVVGSIAATSSVIGGYTKTRSFHAGGGETYTWIDSRDTSNNIKNNIILYDDKTSTRTLTPFGDNMYSLGTSSLRWSTIYGVNAYLSGYIFLNTGDPTLKIYSGKITDAKSDGNICFLTCIDGLDGLSHSYAVAHQARNNIVLQPRGGLVYIGTNPDGGNTSYKLYVNGNIYATTFTGNLSGNADTVDNYHISVTSSAGTNSSTIYFVT